MIRVIVAALVAVLVLCTGSLAAWRLTSTGAASASVAPCAEEVMPSDETCSDKTTDDAATSQLRPLRLT